MSTPQGGQPGNDQDRNQWSGQQPAAEQSDDSGATTVFRPGDIAPEPRPYSGSGGGSPDTGPQAAQGAPPAYQSSAKRPPDTPDDARLCMHAAALAPTIAPRTAVRTLNGASRRPDDTPDPRPPRS